MNPLKVPAQNLLAGDTSTELGGHAGNPLLSLRFHCPERGQGDPRCQRTMKPRKLNKILTHTAGGGVIAVGIAQPLARGVTADPSNNWPPVIKIHLMLRGPAASPSGQHLETGRKKGPGKNGCRQLGPSMKSRTTSSHQNRHLLSSLSQPPATALCSQERRDTQPPDASPCCIAALLTLPQRTALACPLGAHRPHLHSDPLCHTFPSVNSASTEPAPMDFCITKAQDSPEAAGHTSWLARTYWPCDLRKLWCWGRGLLLPLWDSWGSSAVPQPPSYSHMLVTVPGQQFRHSSF